MKTSSFNYEIPDDLIAQTPVEPRDASRLMVVHRASGKIEHRGFKDITAYLQPGDLMVLNETRVIRARLLGHKTETGGKVEVLLLKRQDDRTWECLTRGKSLRPGTRIEFTSDTHRLAATIVSETASGGRMVRFDQTIEPLLDELGIIPLPPYIHKPLADSERYQTVYGHREGSVAASTAGLHFTPDLLIEVREKGVELAYVTLHIGLDTFRPVKEENVEDHQMHTEWYEVSSPVAEQINRARLEGRRIVAVGTTVVRALESAAGGCAPVLETEAGEGASCAWRSISASSGPTNLFIYPSYRFRVVEAMVTNFHLPRSTLLMLVSAFSGQSLIRNAYREAISQRYRFFSFGDAMLLI
jgi:S-adenosylmethionine:tRNA ribosyltransferase-isomerase